MKKTFNEKINSQSGFALVLTLVVMAAMTAIGLAALTNSTTDLLITRNEKEARLAFTLAEIGIDEALSRMSLRLYLLDSDGVPTTNIDPRRVGETPTDKADRIASNIPQIGPGGAVPDAFTSWSASGTHVNAVEVVGLRDEDLGGSYSVDVDYTYESEDPYTWCSTPIGLYDDGCAAGIVDIVLFCEAFGFIGGGALKECDGAEPVYEIISKGKTLSGTEAVVKVYVSASSLNVVPPGNSILFTERKIDLGNNNVKVEGATGGTLGKVAARNIEGDDIPGGIRGNTLADRVQVGNNDTDGCATNNNCIDISDTGVSIIDDWSAGDFEDYLGMPFRDLKGFSDHVLPKTSNNQENVPTGILGTICDEDSVDEADHIDCPLGEPSIVYLDNGDGNGGGTYNIAGGETGRGIMIVTGDLQLAGGFVYEGFIYVLGNLTTTGSTTIWGAIMVKGKTFGDPAIELRGSMTIDGSIPVATAVATSLGISKVLRWQRE